MNFLYPNILWLMAIIPLIVLYYIFVARRKASLTVSTIGGRRAPHPFRYCYARYPSSCEWWLWHSLSLPLPAP